MQVSDGAGILRHFGMDIKRWETFVRTMYKPLI